MSLRSIITRIHIWENKCFTTNKERKREWESVCVRERDSVRAICHVAFAEIFFNYWKENRRLLVGQKSLNFGKKSEIHFVFCFEEFSSLYFSSQTEASSSYCSWWWCRCCCCCLKSNLTFLNWTFALAGLSANEVTYIIQTLTWADYRYSKISSIIVISILGSRCKYILSILKYYSHLSSNTGWCKTMLNIFQRLTNIKYQVTYYYSDIFKVRTTKLPYENKNL